MKKVNLNIAIEPASLPIGEKLSDVEKVDLIKLNYYFDENYKIKTAHQSDGSVYLVLEREEPSDLEDYFELKDGDDELEENQ